MNSAISQLYNFAFRGVLAEEALDGQGRKSKLLLQMRDEEIVKAISLESLDTIHVSNARIMAIVYTAIAAFESGVRELVTKVLRDKYMEDWWEKGFSNGVRERAMKRMEEEQNARWHSQRGQDPINYTTFGDLKNTMQNNWIDFEDLVGSLTWASGIFDVVERSRNVIMHSGMLEREDIDRLGVNIRDWVKQVGA
ncbi:MAG: Swt1 family HEPN domain-containing protein [Pseudomonadota bacterium]